MNQAYNQDFARVYNLLWGDFARSVAPRLHEFYTARPDAEPTNNLPTYTYGLQVLPLHCRTCGGRNEAEQPCGPEIFGRLICTACGRQSAWLRGALRTAPRRSLPAAVATAPRAVATVPARPTPTTWRLPTCSSACQFRQHDPVTHELAGRQALLDEQAAGGGGGLVNAAAVIATGPLTIDVARNRCWVDGAEVALTPTEFKILAVLAGQLGRVCSYPELVGRVWGAAEAAMQANGPTDRRFHTARMHLFRLRGKLGDAARLLESRPFHGVVLLAEPPTGGAS